MSKLDWLILGGGIHGTHLSHVLVHQAGVPPERIRVLDPHDEPLAAFWRMTAATGMRYLRSPGVHHLGLHPHALRRFARTGPGRKLARFVFPYDRPGLAFFRAFTEHVLREHQLVALRERGRALAIERQASGFRVETDQGSLVSERLVLAMGVSEQWHVPPWATLGPRIEHLFDPSFCRSTIEPGANVVIVGGGISAVQLACVLAIQGSEVTLVARHAPRIHRFDSDPAWLGPKAMAGFARTNDLAARRKLISEARHRGSLPPEIHADLRHELQLGRIRWQVDEVQSAHEHAEGVSLRLARSTEPLQTKRVVLATGFDARRPGGALVDAAVEHLRLPCAACGYPAVGPSLAWVPGLFVTGPLAELELGPTARNIAGARAAGERLKKAA